MGDAGESVPHSGNAAAVLELGLAKPYDFSGSVRGHGWVALAPCRWVSERNALQRVERLDSGRVVLLDITSRWAGEEVRVLVQVYADGSLGDDEHEEVGRKVRWLLRLDEDLSEFYRLCAQAGAPWDKAASGHGRLLRSPTLFEDIVKTICTTNITWSQTKTMVGRLVQRLGDPFPLNPGLRAFPTPEQVAAASADVFTQEIRLGYRSAYVQQLAQEVTAGRRDLGALAERSWPAQGLRRALKEIKGVGDYAAGTLMMLLGCYEALAIDSEMRSHVSAKHFDGNPVTDRQIEAIYAQWGRWKYLAYWLELA